MSELICTPQSEIETRIKKLQKSLDQHGVDGAIIVHHTNLFYLSGTSQNCHLFIPRVGEPVLMVKKSFDRAKKESPLEHIASVTSLKEIPSFLHSKGYLNLKVVGFELDIVPFNTVLSYQKLFNQSELVDVSGDVKNIRAVKSGWEIDLLRKASVVIDAVFAEVPGMLREGMTEIELASLFEAGMRRRGYGGICQMRAFNQTFYLGNLVSGASGAVPSYFDGPIGGWGLTPANNPHGAGWKKIMRNEAIYIDYTCVVNGYTADETRMFVLGGLPEKMLHAFKGAVIIQDALKDMAKPAVECHTLYDKAFEMAAEMGYEDNFMGMGKDKVRFVGHGVGLELDEAPTFAKGIRMQLRPNMTFALEPKFVFPEGAIGIENTFLLKEDGVETLTKTPEKIFFV
ncbi:MAG: Xaa-Pro peptidase family protein [Dehalococcoidia bacterium]|nr:Xaa-Pro peptidase family protein [Dehalococcoidia bacterium]